MEYEMRNIKYYVININVFHSAPLSELNNRK